MMDHRKVLTVELTKIITALALILGTVNASYAQDPISYAKVVQGDEKNRVYTFELTYFGDKEGIIRVWRTIGMKDYTVSVQYFQKVDGNRYVLKRELALLEGSVYNSYNLRVQKLKSGNSVIRISWNESVTRDPKSMSIWALEDGNFTTKPPKF